jgi:hypothetical protein
VSFASTGAALLAVIAGATYTGAAAGGGSVQFTVAPDGSRITSYAIRDVPGDTCTFVSLGTEGDWPGVPIVGGAFEHRPHDGELISGSFPNLLTISGTLRFFNAAVPDVRPACDTGTVTWTATTPGTTPPPPPGAETPPGGSPPETGTRARYATRVTLRRRGARLAGRVGSPHRDCRAGRRITLRRGGRKVGTARSRRDGTFRLARTSKTRGRKIRAVVVRRELAAAICATGRSRVLRG